MFYQNKIYKAICTEEWLAKAYSDYLADIAAEQFQLVSDITDLVTDDNLDNSVYSIVARIEDEVQRVRCLVADSFSVEHIGEANYDPWENDGTTTWRIRCSSIADHEGLHNNIAAWVAPLGITDSQVPPGGDLCNLNLDEWFWNHGTALSTLTAKIDAYMQSKALPSDFSFTLNEGMTNFKNMVVAMMKNYSELDSNNFSLLCSDGQSDVGVPKEFKYEDVIDQIKTNAVSALAWAQGFLSCAKESVADGIELFRANMDQVVSDATGKFSSIISTVKSTLANTAGNVSSFLKTATQFIGIDNIGSSFTTVDETDLYDYTGASPLAGINFKSAQGLATAVGRVALAAGAAAWEGLKWIGQKIWKWAKPMLKNLTDDPTDLVVENKNNQSYRIQNWHWQNSTGNPVPIVFTLADGSSAEEIARWQLVVAKLNEAANASDNVISFDTIFGSLNLKIVSATFVNGVIHNTITCNCLIEYYPKPVDYNMAKSLQLVSTSNTIWQGRQYDNIRLGAMSYPDGVSYLTKWETLLQQFVDSGQLRPEDENDEQYMYKCFMTSIIIMNWCLHFITADYSHEFIHQSAKLVSGLINYYDGHADGSRMAVFNSGNSQEGYGNRIEIPLWPHNEPKVTNLDFLKVASGYNPNISAPTAEWSKFDGLQVQANINGLQSPHYFEDRNMTLGANRFGMLILVPFLYSKYEKLYNPTQFSFIPYVRGTSDFSDSRYRIKTDSENQNLVNAFVNIALVIIVIATIIIVGSKIMKTRKLKKLSKMSNYMGQQDNAIWSTGKRLTPKEQRKYLRYSKKYEKISASFTGLAGGNDASASILERVQRVNATVSGVAGVDITKSLMHGEIVEAVDTNANEIAIIKHRLG